MSCDEPELRPCPFCGDLQGCWHLDLALQNGGPDNWNRRPLEDALRAELDVLKRKFTEDGWAEAEGEKYVEGIFDAAPEWQARAEAAEARVRELEAQCAIEPGQESTYDVPASVAKVMWRFWFRMAKIQGKKVAELESHLPRTRDGVCVVPGMVVYCPYGHAVEKGPSLSPWVNCVVRDCDVIGDGAYHVADCTANPPGDAEVRDGE